MFFLSGVVKTIKTTETIEQRSVPELILSSRFEFKSRLSCFENHENCKNAKQKLTHSENPESEYSPKIAIFCFWKVTGPKWGSKFIFSRKEPTRLLGFVIIRLGARAIKKNSGI